MNFDSITPQTPSTLSLSKGCSALAASAALAMATTALAQEKGAGMAADQIRPDAITVLASGSPQRIDQTGQTISVLTAADLDRLQGPDLTRALAYLPGVALSRTGGIGTQTSLFVRGSNSEHVLVLIDGVRLNDVASPKGANDFATLQAGGVGKVELLRGSNSVVWGSEAIGGVLAVTTREVNGIEANLEGGSFGTVAASGVAGLVGSRGAITLNAGYDHTDGISAARSGTEADSYDQWRVGLRGHIDVASGFALNAVARYARSRTEYDGFDASFAPADGPGYQITRQLTGRLGGAYRSASLDLDAGYAVSQTLRDNYDPTQTPAYQYGFSGRSERAELTGRLRLPHAFALDFGTDRELQRLPREGSSSPRSRLWSAHALLGWYGKTAQLAAGLRYDDHNTFGHNWSFGANGSLRLASALRLRASYGEGFRAPTLFELFDPTYGNAAYTSLGVTRLLPERSRSLEAGLEWGAADKVFASVNLFRRDTRNLVDFFSCYGLNTPACIAANAAGFGFGGYYYNAGRTRAEGVELEVAAHPSATLSARMNATFLRARDRDPASFTFGNDLARRPRATVTSSLDWTTPLAGLVLGADTRFRAGSYNDGGNFTRLPGGVTVDLRGSIPLGSRTEFYARIENLFDTYVPTVAGYNTAGRGAFAGLRVRY